MKNGGKVCKTPLRHSPNSPTLYTNSGSMSESDLRRGRRSQNYWLVIIGENDKRNLPETRLTA